MSTLNPYVRETLTATRAGLPDPGLLVDLWLDQLLEHLAGAATFQVERFLPSDAYDIVALYGRLQRCLPEKVVGTGRLADWQAAVKVVEARLPQWLALALQVPDPSGWLVEAGMLADTCDGDSEPETWAGWAEQLLTDLDDADLTAWAARHYGLLPENLEAGLARCSEWLRDNLDRFFPAGVFIQGVGQTIRPDLAIDLTLAGTADKFVLMLDALEEIQERLNPPLGSAVPPSNWAGFPEPSLTLAAKMPDAEGLFRRRWCSPDGNSEALLVVAPDDLGVECVRVNFLSGENVPSHLVGRPVWLAGCPATIDSDGNADFDRSALTAARQEGRPLDLGVGEQREAWPLRRDH